MSSLNRASLIGHLGADPEIRTLPSGNKMANLRLATSKRWKDKTTGEQKEVTQWHTIVIFNEGLVSVVERFARKGSKLFIEGGIETRKWQDKTGADRWTTEILLRNYEGQIVLLDGTGAGRPPPNENAEPKGTATGYAAVKSGDAPPPASAGYDDVIPF